VLGDSSLRFDFALTRRPMLFGVPEGPVYDRLRPEHPDIEHTVPGPHVATTAEAVRKLKDLEAVRREYTDDVEAFVAGYVDLADDRSAARVVEAVFGTRDGGAR
jgi:CDP-glycerol glycerophosphotransferase